MALTIHRWPRAIPYRLSDLIVDAQTRSAGQSVSGREQVAVSGADKWRFRVELPTLSPAQAKSYRAFLARVRGRGNAFQIPVRDVKLWPSSASIGVDDDFYAAGIPFSDGARFSDGAGFAGDDVYAAGIVEPAAIGAVQIDADLSVWGEVLEAGQYFGLDDWLHICTGIAYQSGVATIDFLPPLRRAVTAATQFRFRPVLVCRMEKDDSGRHPLELARFTAPQLDMVEVLER